MKIKRLAALYLILTFVTALAVLNSFVFTVREIRAECVNAEDAELDAAVIAQSGISTGSGIFFIDAREAERRVDSCIGNVSGVEIERFFPSRLVIRYTKVVPALAFMNPNGTYAVTDEGLLITEQAAAASALDLDATGESILEGTAVCPLIEVISGLAPASGGIKTAIVLGSGTRETAAVRAVIEAFHRLGYNEYDLIALLRRIDLSGYNSFEPSVTLTMRERAGKTVTFTVLGFDELGSEKLRRVVTLFELHLKGDIQLGGKTVTVYHDSNYNIMNAAG